MCESEGEAAWITYAVPEDWDNNSRGGGGSGSPLSASLDLGFDLPDGGRINVELDTEPRQPDGSTTTRSGKPFEGFDYDYSIGNDSTTITFDSWERSPPATRASRCGWRPATGPPTSCPPPSTRPASRWPVSQSRRR